MSCSEDKVRAAQAAFAEATSCYNLGPGGERCWLSKNHTGFHCDAGMEWSCHGPNPVLPKLQDQSTQYCGCDAGANHPCAQHPDNFVRCGFSRDGRTCGLPKGHNSRIHQDGSFLFVEVGR